MTEGEAREVLGRAAEAGAFRECYDWWNDRKRPRAFVAELNALRPVADNDKDSPFYAACSAWITGRASEIAEALLGEPFAFPDWNATWRSVQSRREDPLWTAVWKEAGNDDF